MTPSASTTRVAGPPAGIVDLWCVHLDAPNFPDAALAATLDPSEQQHAACMRVGGRAWASGRGAQRVILASYLEVPASALEFFAAQSGKPGLSNAPSLQFSFARTDGLAVVAVASDREVGVDVERENDRTDIDGVAQEFLPAGEAAALEATPLGQRRSAFFGAWARHEARLKLEGQGLTGRTWDGARPSAALVVVRALALPPGFAGAIAAVNDTWTVRVKEFPVLAARLR